ncbi:FUSC family protein [Cryptosporangium aurantiacum]|uniref:FUSC family protein n=1 Tax=Cryptosporangium aurantiacum TaxID=134849 RepID=UPI0015BEB414|nr:FUSC family protein [Cryptosporangium aurantiacum]
MRAAIGGLISVPRAKLSPRVAARGTIAVALPLLIGGLAGAVLPAVAATLGAYFTGFADLSGPYRRRLRLGFALAVCGALSVLLGALVQPHTVLAVLLIALWGFLAGLLTALGPAGTRVGITGLIVLIVLGEQPQEFSQALLAAAAVFVGAGLQTLLAIAPWPVRGYAPERAAIAAAYRQLTDVDPTGAGPAYPAVLEAHAALQGLDPQRNRTVAGLRILLDEVERARGEVVALAGLRARLEDMDRNDAADEVAAVLEAASAVGAAVAERLTGDPDDLHPDVPPALDDALERAVAAVRARADGPGRAPLTRRGAATRSAALAGQLRAARRIVESTDPDVTTTVHGGAPVFVMPADEPVTVLRANLRPSSAAFRHALRLAFTLAAVATALAVLGLPRGYWLLLTVAVAIRPDFSATVKQVVDRVAGTLLGMLVVSALLEWVVSETWQKMVLVPVFYFFLRTVLAANFALGAAAMAGNAVLIADLLGASAGSLIPERLTYTVAAGAIALAAYLAWPTWERSTARDTLAESIERARSYLRTAADPDASDTDVDAARTVARVALSNARDSAKRLADEPGTPPALVDLAHGVTVHSSRLVQGGMALEAARDAHPEGLARPEARAFAGDVDTALALVATALRTGRRPRPLPPLRADVDRLIAVAPNARLATFATAADRLTDGIGTLNHLLRQDAKAADAQPR